jgi:hypothetical protein
VGQLAADGQDLGGSNATISHLGHDTGDRPSGA